MRFIPLLPEYLAAPLNQLYAILPVALGFKGGDRGYRWAKMRGQSSIYQPCGNHHPCVVQTFCLGCFKVHLYFCSYQLTHWSVSLINSLSFPGELWWIIPQLIFGTLEEGLTLFVSLPEKKL